MRKASISISRLWQIRSVVRKYDLTSLLEELSLSKTARLAIRLFLGSPKTDSSAAGPRIRQALEELGPVFVKLGQTLSTRPDLLPPEIAEELAKLQDQVPAFSGSQALEIIREAFGRDVDTIFASIDSDALASASVAQVHAATLQPGLAIEGQNGKASDEVIIKVLRPGIEKTIESDLSVMYTFAGLLQKHWSRGQQFKPLEVIKEYDNTIHDELDLRMEAANGGRMGANFEDTDIIYVPRIYWDYTRQNVLVMERIYGTPIKDFKALAALGHDMEQLAADGVNVFFKQAFEDNFFHADMHAGNIFVSEAGKWMAIDFGIMGTLEERDKQFLAQMLLGFFNRDYRSIAVANLNAGWVPAGTRLEDFESAVRMVCEPNFAKPIAEISFGNVLLQLFQTMRRFEMPVQPQLVLLYKTLLNIEGLGRQLYPQLNLWDTAKPFLENWMKEQLSPQALLNDFKRDWPQWRAMLPELPVLLKEVLENTAKPPPAESVQRKLPKTAAMLSVAGLGVLIAAQLGVVLPAALVNAAPWASLFGLLWILRR